MNRTEYPHETYILIVKDVINNLSDGDKWYGKKKESKEENKKVDWGGLPLVKEGLCITFRWHVSRILKEIGRKNEPCKYLGEKILNK